MRSWTRAEARCSAAAVSTAQSTPAGPKLVHGAGRSATGRPRRQGHRRPSAFGAPCHRHRGPGIERRRQQRSRVVRSCYARSLALAAERPASIAFPAISRGIYRYPLEPDRDRLDDSHLLKIERSLERVSARRIEDAAPRGLCRAIDRHPRVSTGPAPGRSDKQKNNGSNLGRPPLDPTPRPRPRH